MALDHNIPRLDFGLPAWLTPFATRALSLSRLEEFYAQACAKNKPGFHVGTFCEHALAALKVEVVWPHAQLEALRAIQGPLLFVANHPFGGIDALILMAIMGRVRSNFAFMANSILQVIPQLEPALIGVHIMESKQTLQQRRSANVQPVRAAVRALRGGRALGLFPAGEVADLPNFMAQHIVERPWNPLVGTLCKSSRANIVPVFFDGQNSALFRYGGLAFPQARIALLAREMMRANLAPRFVIGAVVQWRDELYEKSAQEITNGLRATTLALKTKPDHDKERI